MKYYRTAVVTRYFYDNIPYLISFIEYYKKIATQIIVIDKCNNADNFKEKIQKYIDSKDVIYLDICKILNIKEPLKGTIDYYYKYIVDNFSKQFDFFAWFDCDEFIDFNGNFKNFNEYFNWLDDKNIKYDMIYIPWLINTKSTEIFLNEKNILDDYFYGEFYSSNLGKMITKSNIIIKSMHFEIIPSKILINPDGSIINKQNECKPKDILNLKHIRNTSIEYTIKHRIKNWIFNKTAISYLQIPHLQKNWNIDKQLFYNYVYFFCKKYNVDFKKLLINSNENINIDKDLQQQINQQYSKIHNINLIFNKKINITI